MTVTLYFTAAGRRDEGTTSFEQRMFEAQATLVLHDGTPRLADWRSLREIVALDPHHYMPTDRGVGEVGKIKAFRDPAYFRDALSGHEYILFAGSIANSRSSYNGAVGVARRNAQSSSWDLCPPLVSADGLNNELERPHIVRHADLYYLFWSTQRHVFDPSGVQGPTGLYGMVSSHLLDGWRPINGTGLVFANPESAPAQAYSWLVLPDLSVASFVDNWGSGATRRFGGTFAPFVRLALNEDQAWLQGPA
jgi:levansucrase